VERITHAGHSGLRRACLAGTAGFLLLTALVVTGPTWLTSFDAHCSSAAHGFTADHSWFETLCRAATWTAGAPVVVALTSVAVLTCLMRRRRMPSDVLGGWLLGSAWITAATLLLARVDRPGRPSGDPASA
jgi:hypothetical protein